VTPAWKWKTASAIATVVQLAAGLSLLRVVLPEDSWFTDVADGIGYFFGLPIDGNLFIALVFFVLGAALQIGRASCRERV
jgi:lysyl-tRNA synthetase class 2